ncbi:MULTISPECIES: methyl-accepting chemotaxis protein [unclassified Herbaspirillum]|uniref:methyl-accepting chemotaxis protein n=1 Tax=unclassified Herbaspirillum TaxID=2624150 RepID=UPI00115473C5|nr:MULTISPECIES: methyl-accepting chemotaxis protein [unclassified Herbaspirillum]MBB5392037.1 methyl-accepting chemotaxis protein [Herbaspirillum sp. SJZ102]TQK13496.1 methyl-accepting chemotaxis sensory transducer with Cache sensor [Herbaspirillum sp. SJZ130]TQK15499.1 methyl-accepting chemotaxis sensory transducer with Cache sensor [Herbaspirillum sp. SJZ106]
MLSSLRARLIVICVLIVAVAMIVLSAANIFTVRRDTLAALQAQTAQLTDSHAANIAEWVRSKRTITASMKQALKQEDVLPIVAAAMEAGAFDDAYIGYPDKRMLALHPMPPGYDPTSRPWYQQAVNAGKPVLTAPYVDATTGKLVVTFAEAVGGKDNLQAVVGSDVQLDNVVRNVAGIKPTPGSFAFIVGKDGTIVTHPNKELALKPVSALDQNLSAQSLASTGQGGEASIGGARYLLFVRPIEGTDWSLAVALDYVEATQSIRALMTMSLVLAVLAIAAAAALLTLTITGMLRRLGVVRDVMEDIASGEGDLTRRLDTQGRDELSQISGAFNRFADKISTTLLEIRRASESVKTSSGEIASGNLDLSGRTEQQAGSLEETASAMEQLTSTVKQNADNARQANQLAVSASEVAVQGGEVVGKVVDTMSSINDSSRKIVDIISVIDGIAFQTNILALNAAVEAARAGEQGRGFAVVASEVRSLAQRSATAAKEIKGLIDDSVHKVEVGSALVHQAGNTMTEVVASVRRVTDIVGEISAASQEQSSGIAEIGRAVTQMDEATQQNAALVEQAAAAAQSLQEQAAHLAGVVAGFKLDESHLQAAVPLSRPAAPARPVPTPAAVAVAGPQKPAIAKPATAAALPAAKAAAPRAAAAPAKPKSDEGDNWEEF